MYHFDALYFDGVSSSPRSCLLEVKPDAIQVRAAHAGGGELDFLVEGAELKRSSLSTIGADELFTLRIGAGGVRCFEVRQPGFKQALRTLPETARPRGVHEKRPTVLLVGGLVAGMAAFMALSWFVLIPQIGDWAGNAMPHQIENLIGKSLEDSLVTKYPVDKQKTAAFYRFAAAVGLPDADKLRFYVVASAQTNAFAVMGGSIFVFEPMLRSVKSGDEFAALLFHEYTHIKNKHTARTTMRTLAAYLFISAIISDTSGIVAGLLQNLETLQNLDYSRDFEREADAGAELMLAERGMDLDAFAVLMEHLQLVSKDSFRMAEFLSSHPDEQQRINSARALATKYRITPPEAKVAVGDYLAIWDELQE